MINFNKNKLINKTLDKYYETFSHMLDTADYVPEKFNNKISKYIYKNMKKSFKRIDKEDNKYQKDLKRKKKTTEKKAKSKIVLFFLKLFSHKKRSEIVKETAESEQSERINSESGLCSALDNGTSELNSCDTNTKQ
ncbi:MAG: hypothetical protein ACI4TT_01750 [Christensenellales bacterium]